MSTKRRKSDVSMPSTAAIAAQCPPGAANFNETQTERVFRKILGTLIVLAGLFIGGAVGGVLLTGAELSTWLVGILAGLSLVLVFVGAWIAVSTAMTRFAKGVGLIGLLGALVERIPGKR